MIPAPSSARIHLAALSILVACTWLSWRAQARRTPPELPAVASAADGAPAAAVLLFGGRLDLNRADANDLSALPGIGAVRAARILEARAALGGRFEDVDDLLDVPGIGPATLARLRPLVAIGPATSSGPGTLSVFQLREMFEFLGVSAQSSQNPQESRE